MLFLYEMGVGLFLGAKDIPAAVWAVVAGFGAAYVVVVYFAESVVGKQRIDAASGGGAGIRGM